MDNGAACDVLPDQRDRGTLARHDERDGAAEGFSRNNYDLALAGLFLGRAAVGTIGLRIRLFDLAAEICAINRDSAGEFGLMGVVNLGA